MAVQFPDPSVTPIFNGPNGVTYQWDEDDGKWIVKSSGFSTDYVSKTGGDTMDGPLNVMGDREPNDDGVESTIKAYNIDSGRNGDLQLKRNGQTKIYCSGTGVTLQGNLKMNIEASTLKSSTNTDLFIFNKSGVFYDGAYTAERHIATKQQVDDAVKDFATEQYVDDAIATIEGDVDLDNISSISFVTDGVIKHSTNNRITFQNSTSATTGSGLVQFERPSTSGRRGFTIRGKNTDNNDDDLLYTYTFAAGGDAVGYTGRIVNDNHITNKKYVDEKVQSVSATTIWYPLTYTRSTAGVNLGYFYWITNQLIYRKTVADQIIPKLKVGDECRIVKLDGSVAILRVTQIDNDVNSNYSFGVLNTTPTVTLDAGDVNTMFEVSFNFF